MANVSFNNLKLSTNKEVKIAEFNNTKIEVLQYLPVEDKNDLIQITMQKSFMDGYFNEILLDAYFHLNIIYLYTNLNITEKQREDELKLYDKIYSSGLLEVILEQLPEDEYKYIFNMLQEQTKDFLTYKNSAAAVVQSFIQDLPANAAAAADIVNNWDADKFQSVQDMVQLARQTGMNPPIPESAETAAPAEANLVNFLEEQAKLEKKE